jgi:hypothetical protein
MCAGVSNLPHTEEQTPLVPRFASAIIPTSRELPSHIRKLRATHHTMPNLSRRRSLTMSRISFALQQVYPAKLWLGSLQWRN